MKTKKLIIPLLLASFICLVMMQSLTPPPPITPSGPFEMEPPIVKHVWIRKLKTLGSKGENVLLKIEYYPDSRLDSVISIFVDGSTTITFYDNGTGPDATQNDLVYSAYIKEDLVAFKNRVTQLNLTSLGNGGVLHFTGHFGSHVSPTPFDFDKFDNGDEQPIDLALLDATQCDAELLKQNSLFITDLTMVEDGARTYNHVWDTGNISGIYTFGKLIENICNNSSTPVSPKEFLKRWLRRWTDTVVINGETVYPRAMAYNFIIAPWIINAGGSVPVGYNEALSELDAWEPYWDLCDEEALLEAAPFKLMAIVNRLDLRGNMAYSSILKNAGETRLIYTLVAPFDMDMSNLNMPSTAAGMPPKASDGANFASCAELLDWKGMNVIFEYGNPQNNKCDIKDFAQAWADLSELSLGSADYKDALEDIVRTVIDANSNMNRSNNNNSCLNRIRTNERIFAESGTCNPGSFSIWASNSWEMSQFELSGGYLIPAPVTNTPRNASNTIWDEIFSYTSTAQPFKTTNLFTYTSSNANARPLIEWTYANQTQVALGNHNMPASFTYGGNTMYLAGTAKLDMESAHYWDLDWKAASTAHYTSIAPVTVDATAKNLRRQISVNTCQGCHAGENKTLFTQVTPLGYGQHNRYWLSTPDKDFARADTSRFVANEGWNNFNGSVMRNRRILPGNQYYTRTSGFLTGRYYGGSGSWEDDWTNSGADPYDNDMDEYFYVFDPNAYWLHNSGQSISWIQPDGVNGFNDLALRKQKLCQLLHISCSISLTESILVNIIHNINSVPYVE